MRRFPSWGPHPWIPACAGMTVMQRVSLAGMTVVQRSAFAGDTMALRRPNKGMKMGAAAPGVWSRVQGRGWVPAFAGTTVMQRVSLAGMTVVQRSAFAGDTMALRRPNKGMKMGAAAPGVWSRVQGRGWVPAFAGTTGGAWHVFSHSNDGCARVSLAGMTVVQRSPCAGMTVVQGSLRAVRQCRPLRYGRRRGGCCAARRRGWCSRPG